MKKTWFTSTLLLIGLSLNIQAFTYQDGDLLLVFRKDGANDLLFNLGAVSQLLNVPAGQTVNAPSNYSSALVKSTYGVDDSGHLESDVRFAILSTTRVDAAQKMAWLSCSEDAVTPLDRTASQWQGLWSKIDSIGARPQQFTQTNTAATYAVEPSHFSSYSTIINISAAAAAPKLGGAAAFNVEGLAPAKVRWFEIKPSTASTKPNAKQIGYFTLGTDASLKFTGGVEGVVNPDPVVPASVKSISISRGRAVLSFDGKTGTSYRLKSATSIETPLAQWTVGATVATGANVPASLSEPASGPNRFFVIEAFRP